MQKNSSKKEQASDKSEVAVGSFLLPYASINQPERNYIYFHPQLRAKFESMFLLW